MFEPTTAHLRKPGIVGSACISAAAAAFLALVPVQADERLRIHLEAGLLTLETERVSVAEIVGAIGKRVGFEIIIVGDLGTPVTVSFEKVPVREALEKLLRDTDRILVYGKRDQNTGYRAIDKLWVFEKSRVALNSRRRGGDQAAFETVFRDETRHPDARTRSLAIFRLSNDGATEPTLAALTEALLGDENALVRSRAAIALGKLNDERIVPALESALSDDHVTVRAQAIHALGEIDSMYAAMVLGDVLLHGTDDRERVIAAWALAKHNSQLSNQYLDAVVNDPDQQVRAASKRKRGRRKYQVIQLRARQEWLGPENVR